MMSTKNSPAVNPTSTAPRRRIALLIHSLEGGGAERVMSRLANRWSSLHEIHLITWSKVATDRYPLEPSIVRHGLDLQTSSRGLIRGVLANLKRVRKLRRVLRQLNPDFVLSFCDQMNIVCLEAMRVLPQTPVWIAEHSDPEKQRLSPLWEAWRRRNYSRCTGCIALTDSIAQWMTCWVTAEKLRVIPSAVEAPSASLSSYVHTPASGLNSLLFLGRLSREKRVELLLEAWGQLAPQLANWQLRIVGDGPLRSELEQMAARTQRVQFLGWQERSEAILATSQLYVLCSRYEGFPIALLEALSHGLPAIATNCSSAIDQLRQVTPQAVPLDSVDPIRVIPTESVTGLAQAIVELAQDPQLRQRMSQAAQQVAQKFSWQEVGKMWDSILEGS